jgi:hypothetical protein
VDLRPDIVSLILAAGNGSEVGPLSTGAADTWIPLPNSLAFPKGVLEDFRIHISQPPGGGGSYQFLIEDLTTGTSSLICSISDTAAAPANQNCSNLEQITSLEAAVSAFDLVGIVAERVGVPFPANDVDVTYTMGYVHCSGGDVACP